MSIHFVDLQRVCDSVEIFIWKLGEWLVHFEKLYICKYINTDFSSENKPFKL